MTSDPEDKSIQELEYKTPLRIKFASIDHNGVLHGDAHEEYDLLFPGHKTELEEGTWIAVRDGSIETRSESWRNTWMLRHNNTLRIVAVEHETGIEFLFDPELVKTITNIGEAVATTAVISFMKHMWKKWRALRASSKVPKEEIRISPDGNVELNKYLEENVKKIEPAIVIERVSEYYPDGKIKMVERVERRGPIDTEIIGDVISKVFTDLKST